MNPEATAGNPGGTSLLLQANPIDFGSQGCASEWDGN
jgi:hypothetical protein